MQPSFRVASASPTAFAVARRLGHVSPVPPRTTACAIWTERGRHRPGPSGAERIEGLCNVGEMATVNVRERPEGLFFSMRHGIDFWHRGTRGSKLLVVSDGRRQKLACCMLSPGSGRTGDTHGRISRHGLPPWILQRARRPGESEPRAPAAFARTSPPCPNPDLSCALFLNCGLTSLAVRLPRIHLNMWLAPTPSRAKRLRRCDERRGRLQLAGSRGISRGQPCRNRSSFRLVRIASATPGLTWPALQAFPMHMARPAQEERSQAGLGQHDAGGSGGPARQLAAAMF